MSERGRGSGPDERAAEGDDAEREHASEEYLPPPATARPIAPYDPYRPRTGDEARLPSPNVAADPFQPPRRSVSRGSRNDAFLPDDDPLSAEAWQLEMDDAILPGESDQTLPGVERSAPPAPRRTRRQSPSTRGREPAAGAGRSARRGRAAAAGTRPRVPRPAVTIGVPQAVSGSSLVADQTAMALLGLNLASFLVMALLLGVRMGGIPSPTVLHLDAAGNPDRWGTPSILWRLPLTAFFLTLMFLIVAWFLHPMDRFAARFALGAAVVAQVIAWVAVIQYLA